MRHSRVSAAVVVLCSRFDAFHAPGLCPGAMRLSLWSVPFSPARCHFSAAVHPSSIACTRLHACMLATCTVSRINLNSEHGPPGAAAELVQPQPGYHMAVMCALVTNTTSVLTSSGDAAQTS